MAFCPKCGKESKDGAKFCGDCGNEISKASAEIQNGHNKLNSMNALKSKKRNIGKIIAVVTMVIVVWAVFFGKSMWLNSHPVEKLLYGLNAKNTAKTLEIASKTEIDFKGIPGDKDERNLVAFLENTVLKADTKIDNKQNRIEVGLELYFKEAKMLSAQVYMDEELIAIEVPMLKDEYFYLNWDEMDMFLEEMGGVNLDLNDYKAVFDIKKAKSYKEIKKDYFIFVKENLESYIQEGRGVDIVIDNEESDKVISCSELVLKLENEDKTNIMKSLVKKASEDEKLKNFVKGRVIQLSQIVEENGDGEALYVDDDYFEGFIEDFDDIYQRSFDFIYDELDHEMDRGIDMGCELKYRFDSKNILRNVIAKLEYEAYGIGITATTESTFEKINETIEIEKPDFDDAIDIVRTSAGEWESIIEDMEFRAVNIILMNPMLTQIAEDMDFYF